MMEQRYISKEEFKKYKLYEASQNAESDLYYYQDIMLKLLYSSVLNENRMLTICSLDRINHEDCTKVYEIVSTYDGSLGFTMQRLKNYRTLATYISKLNDRNISLEERKKLIKRINDIFEYFDKISFAYYDVHAENIMFKSGDIKLVDLDSGIFKSIDSERYQQDVVKSNNNLASLYLEIMLGYIEEFSISYMLTNNQINKLLSQSTSKQLEFLLNAVVGTSSVIDLPSYIDSFDEPTVLRMKRIVFGE